MLLSQVIRLVINQRLMLVSLKNIHSVLEENEIEAWQKLIRILTHEIMNSIAPVTSLTVGDPGAVVVGLCGPILLGSLAAVASIPLKMLG